MKYKDYTAIIEYDDEQKIFRGRVIGINDVINFYGRTPEELERELKISVNEYIKFCKEVKKSPQKPYSGKILIRTEPELHRAIAYKAEKAKMSINQWIENALQNFTLAT